MNFHLISFKLYLLYHSVVSLILRRSGKYNRLKSLHQEGEPLPLAQWLLDDLPQTLHRLNLQLIHLTMPLVPPEAAAPLLPNKSLRMRPGGRPAQLGVIQTRLQLKMLASVIQVMVLHHLQVITGAHFTIC
jgi:hypothetical protein